METKVIIGVLSVLLTIAIFALVVISSNKQSKKLIKDLNTKLIVAEEVKNNALKTRDEFLNESTLIKSKSDQLFKELKDKQQEILDLQSDIGEERERNTTLLSQKKSSETRLGQISEHLVPFLKNCPYDPKSMHFAGNPIDYIVYDFDAGKIVFLEVKSGNSKASKRQKIIKNIIKTGRVYYEELRINSKGVKIKRTDNEDEEDAAS